MKKLTGKEILNILNEKEISWSDLGYGEVDWETLDLGKVVTVVSYGSEGMGDEYYAVYHFINHHVYIRIDGCYQLYIGAEFYEAPYEVKPEEKIITVYKPC